MHPSPDSLNIGHLFPRKRARTGEIDHELLWGILGGMTLTLVHSGLKPSLLRVPCLFRTIARIPCPSCGMTRAWEALGRLEFALAFRMHPLLTAGYFALWLYVPYALGACLGLWPRLGVRPSPIEARLLRLGAFSSVALTWAFLIRDGR